MVEHLPIIHITYMLQDSDVMEWGGELAEVSEAGKKT